MRVIAGTARGKNLQALPGEDITRPTINRVKEAMFSSVQFLVPGARCWICSQAAASWASRLCPAVQKLPLCGPLRRGARHCEGQLQNGRGGPPE